MIHRIKFLFGLVSYLLVTTCFLTITLMNQTTYDDWILHGIVFPAVVYVLTSIASIMLVENNKELAVIAGIFVAALNVVPGLKYPFFYDTFDGPGHYGFASEIALTGEVPTYAFYSTTYGSNPGRHIFIASLSIVLGVSVNDVLRLIVPTLFGLIPLVIYWVGHGILNDNTLKFTIIASVLPAIKGFELWGTALAFVPYLLLVAVLVRLLLSKTPNWVLATLFFIFSFTLIDSHAITSLITSGLLIGLFLMSLLFRKKWRIVHPNVRLSGLIALSFSALLWGWWALEATNLLDLFATSVKELLSARAPAVPTRFYQLSLTSQLQTLLVLNAANAIIYGIGLLGFVMLVKRARAQIRAGKIVKDAKGLYLMITTMFVIVVCSVAVQIVVNFGVFSYERLMIYGVPWCFFLAGLVLERLDSMLRAIVPKLKTAIFASIVFALVFGCFVQVYPPQSLIPTANALSKSLPKNAYIVDVNLVNTIYQKDMILFAEFHCMEGPIAADIVTRFQSYGFSNSSFFSRIEYASPLDPNSNRNLKWNLFLLHFSSAGPFGEKVEYRTDEIIQNVQLSASDLVYNNGPSFIMWNVNASSR